MLNQYELEQIELARHTMKDMENLIDDGNAADLQDAVHEVWGNSSPPFQHVSGQGLGHINNTLFTEVDCGCLTMIRAISPRWARAEKYVAWDKDGKEDTNLTKIIFADERIKSLETELTLDDFPLFIAWQAALAEYWDNAGQQEVRVPTDDKVAEIRQAISDDLSQLERQYE